MTGPILVSFWVDCNIRLGRLSKYIICIWIFKWASQIPIYGIICMILFFDKVFYYFDMVMTMGLFNPIDVVMYFILLCRTVINGGRKESSAWQGALGVRLNIQSMQLQNGDVQVKNQRFNQDFGFCFWIKQNIRWSCKYSLLRNNWGWLPQPTPQVPIM